MAVSRHRSGQARRGALTALAAALVALAPLCAAQSKWADPGKTLRVMFPIAETGFDPQATSDLYSSHINRAIFEPLFGYEYLTRPYKVAPLTAAAMPAISADGRTWTIKVKPGTYFSDDPAFKGRKRELTAHDFVWSFARLFVPGEQPVGPRGGDLLLDRD